MGVDFRLGFVSIAGENTPKMESWRTTTDAEEDRDA